ncbi:hypothetical protein V1514DRAFT_341624 [Lipomyces japonicus]|uniref:uncharacterized protein n=1 Tax=Lipomyces japonicus TaxID=56871 RepID=UPI0034CED179
MAEVQISRPVGDVDEGEVNEPVNKDDAGEITIFEPAQEDIGVDETVRHEETNDESPAVEKSLEDVIIDSELTAKIWNKPEKEAENTEVEVYIEENNQHWQEPNDKEVKVLADSDTKSSVEINSLQVISTNDIERATVQFEIASDRLDDTETKIESDSIPKPEPKSEPEPELKQTHSSSSVISSEKPLFGDDPITPEKEISEPTESLFDANANSNETIKNKNIITQFPKESSYIPKTSFKTTGLGNSKSSATSSLSLEIPVDKLSSSSTGFPTARLSTMRTFSSRTPVNSNRSTSNDAESANLVKNESAETARAEDEVLEQSNYQDVPSELIQLANRFIESIHQIVGSRTLSPEKLSELFQEFYLTSHDRASALLRRNNMRRTYEVQMMSMEEIARKKKERKEKEVQKLIWEELVERKVCEHCYDDIFMFSGSDDEAKDATLATKIAALKLINISMEHLGVTELKDENVDSLLVSAKDDLKKINIRRNPKDKLKLLISAHKQIVDVLAQLAKENDDKQSGADFILPTLIYAVIQADPPHIASNLAFIQRFRASKSLNGEAAYCLTNFEAVVAFLETVDLTTLKVDPAEISALVSRPPPSTTIRNPLESPKSRSSTPPGSIKSFSAVPVSSNSPISQTGSASSMSAGREFASFPPRNSSVRPEQNRRTFRPTEFAASAVSSADQGIKSLGSTFENSYKFLFAKVSQANNNKNNNVTEKPVQMRSRANAEALERRTQQVLESSSALISTFASSKANQEESGTSVSSKSEQLPSKASSQFPAVRLLERTEPGAETDLTRSSSKDDVDNTGEGIRSIFANMRNFGRGASFAREAFVTPEILKALPKIAKSPAKFANLENSSQLNLGDLEELITDYRRLSEYIKSISGFDE